MHRSSNTSASHPRRFPIIIHVEADSMDKRNTLTIGLSNYLAGEPVSTLIDENWARIDDTTRAHFNNYGFDVDPTDVPKMLADLRNELQSRRWDGVLVAWCSRGYPERTELFEQIVAACLGEARVQKDMKLIFNTGPQNLAEPMLRNFPEVAE